MAVPVPRLPIALPPDWLHQMRSTRILEAGDYVETSSGIRQNFVSVKNPLFKQTRAHFDGHALISVRYLDIMYPVIDTWEVRQIKCKERNRARPT
jgi:hypothetical protein